MFIFDNDMAYRVMTKKVIFQTGEVRGSLLRTVRLASHFSAVKLSFIRGKVQLAWQISCDNNKGVENSIKRIVLSEHLFLWICGYMNRGYSFIWNMTVLWCLYIRYSLTDISFCWDIHNSALYIVAFTGTSSDMIGDTFPTTFGDTFGDTFTVA